jgi:hypothetical protein
VSTAFRDLQTPLAHMWNVGLSSTSSLGK